MLPHITATTDTSVLMDEWKVLSVDVTMPEWLSVSGSTCATESILEVSVDICWNYVLQRRNVLGHLKYQNLRKVVKTCLSCSHGNADSERSYSVNKNLVTVDGSCLLEDTVTAIRVIKDGIHMAGCSSNVIVTRDMLQRVRASAGKYKEWKEEKKRAEEQLKQVKASEQLRKQEEDKAKNNKNKNKVSS